MEQYINKENTPLTWYKFTKYVRTPIGIAINLYNAYLMMTTRINELTICFSAIYFVSICLLLMFFFGSFKWKRYSWIAIISSVFINVFVCFCYYAIATGDTLKTLAYTLGVAAFSTIDFVYFKKRELLFEDKTSTSNNIDLQPTRSIFHDTDIQFCRKCGTKLDPDSVFCKKCGTRVGG